VGEHAEVAAATLVSSSIGAGSLLRAGVEVRDSVLLPGVSVGEGSTIEGSILGNNVTVGAGTSIRNLSVIGDGVEIPAGVTIDGESISA